MKSERVPTSWRTPNLAPARRSGPTASPTAAVGDLSTVQRHAGNRAAVAMLGSGPATSPAAGQRSAAASDANAPLPVGRLETRRTWGLDGVTIGSAIFLGRSAPSLDGRMVRRRLDRAIQQWGTASAPSSGHVQRRVTEKTFKKYEKALKAEKKQYEDELPQPVRKVLPLIHEVVTQRTPEDREKACRSLVKQIDSVLAANGVSDRLRKALVKVSKDVRDENLQVDPAHIVSHTQLEAHLRDDLGSPASIMGADQALTEANLDRILTSDELVRVIGLAQVYLRMKQDLDRNGSVAKAKGAPGRKEVEMSSFKGVCKEAAAAVAARIQPRGTTREVNIAEEEQRVFGGDNHAFVVASLRRANGSVDSIVIDPTWKQFKAAFGLDGANADYPVVLYGTTAEIIRKLTALGARNPDRARELYRR